MNTRNDPGGPSHHLYFLVSVSNVDIQGTTFRNGDSWSVQIYPDGGLKDMTFSNVTWSNVYAGIYVGPGSYLTFDGVTASSNRYVGDGVPWFSLSGSDITVQNFNVSGASKLVSASGSNIVFRNGTYAGTNLGSGATFDAVNTGSVTTTTQPVTTTTQPVTTTTQPVTTTTQPVTTTTQPVTTTTQPVTTTTQPVTTTTQPVTTATQPVTTTTQPVTTTTQPVTTTTQRVTTTTQRVTTTTQPVTTTTQPVTTATQPVTTDLPQIPTTTQLNAVTITSPQDLSTVQGRVNVRVSLYSPFAINKVRLYVDERLIGQDLRAPIPSSGGAIGQSPATHTPSQRRRMIAWVGK